ncbi:MAG: hypothetical protein IAI50_16325, partial [Candidatus Eremiobacteraeota bacterium]|nr:hypothetical protein [Candidatus Eremiobacteraeota bacterium]
MLRGTAAGLEFVFGEADFGEAWAEMAQRLSERPDFYRGSSATVVFESEAPDDAAIAEFLRAVGEYGIVLKGVYGARTVEQVAERHALPYLGSPPRPSVVKFERKRSARPERPPELTERARSLDADFAGARADIAQRRALGEPSVPRPVFAPPTTPVVTNAVPAAAVAPVPATLY